ncbi:FkbM family methyltransferase [Spirosoma utsteinense]|nr:FkbM family methyltransferase [Spirosoma utsteinense]
MKLQRAQSLYNMKLNESRQNLLNRVKSRLVQIAFDNVKKSNPLIETNIGKFSLQLPFDHQLPFIIKRSPYYSTNLARIARKVNEKYVDLKFIDIGANVGDSVALLRSEATFPVLCIEGDDYFFSILERNASRFSDVYLAKNYVGEITTEVNAVSVELGGTAHLLQNAANESKISIKKISTILNDYPLFKTSKMLKVDTDGFDNKIIRGSADFLENAKPVIFFEYDPYFLSQQNDDGISIFSTLVGLGYNKLLIYENDGEFLLSADTDNRMLLEDITYFYTGRKGLRYCDICAFHKEDNDIFENVRLDEIKFFSQVRSSKK